ncbi:MAG TPA: TraR/DksA C4-type zinc finger protein [Actinomycetota bacterium]
MPSKTAGGPNSKVSASARPPVTKSAAKASTTKETASGKSASSSATSAEAELHRRAELKGAKPKARAAPKTKGTAEATVKTKAEPKTKAAPKAKAKARAEPTAKAEPKATVKTKKAPAKAAGGRSPAKPAAKAATPAAAEAPAARVAARTPTAKDLVKVGKKRSYDKDSLGTIRKRLMEQREELQNQLAAIEESATGLSQSEMSGEVSYDEDFADAGSFTFEREKEFSIANNVTDLRTKTDRALHRIEEGSYGICESCGQPIEPARLKALPHVTLCLKCKKAEERR